MHALKREGNKMPEQMYALGRSSAQYRDGDSNTITFVLTEDCNLRCSYCYLVHKVKNHAMPREVAFKAVDFALIVLLLQLVYNQPV